MATCGKCGNALKEGTKFCGTCGWKVPQAPAPSAAPAPQPSDAEVTSLLTAPSAGPPAAAVAPPPGPPPSAPPPPAAPVPAKPAAAPRPPAPAPKKKKSALGCILVVLAILVVIFVLAAGGGAWWYFKGGGAQWVAIKMGKAPILLTEPAPGEQPPPENIPPPSETPPAESPSPETYGTPSPAPTEPSAPPVQPQPTPPEPKPAPSDSKIVVDRPALRAAKESAEVALKSLREAIEAAARAGAERVSGQAMDALREERRSVERAFERAKSPSDFEAVTSSARKGVSKALELKAQAEKAAAPAPAPEESGMRKSSAPPPSAPEAPPPKQPKASFGFIFETPVNGNKLVLKVDGEKLIEQEFQVAHGSYRLAKDFSVAPGQHHLRAAVHQSDGKVVSQDWDFNFQLGSTPVFKVVLEDSPRKMTMKKVQ